MLKGISLGADTTEFYFFITTEDNDGQFPKFGGFIWVKKNNTYILQLRMYAITMR